MSPADAAEVIQETTLAAVLERVPALVQAMHKPSLAELLASCQRIRQHLHSTLTGVQQAYLTRPELKLLQDAKWPHLQKLSIEVAWMQAQEAAELANTVWPFICSGIRVYKHHCAMIACAKHV